MVLRARPHAHGVTLDWHDLDAELPSLGTFDLVVSGSAVHPPDPARKRRLYEEVWALLEPGGVFCSLEIDVHSETDWLREIGFADVDCHWKWRELALIVGRKAAAAEAQPTFAHPAGEVSMSAVTFRKLRDEEFDIAHGILVSAADWLLKKGIRQWTIGYPKEAYLACQEQGWNYALEYEGEVAAVLTLSQEVPPAWADHFGNAPFWWLSKLATAPAFHGRGVGPMATRCAIGVAYNENADRLCLDCVHGNGFLVDFYRSLGFRAIDRRDVPLSTDVLDMVLMELKMVRV